MGPRLARIENVGRNFAEFLQDHPFTLRRQVGINVNTAVVFLLFLRARAIGHLSRANLTLVRLLTKCSLWIVRNSKVDELFFQPVVFMTLEGSLSSDKATIAFTVISQSTLHQLTSVSQWYKPFHTSVVYPPISPPCGSVGDHLNLWSAPAINTVEYLETLCFPDLAATIVL